MNKKVGRPPTNEGGAMTKILRVRVPQWMLDYLDDKGERSEVARQIIEDAREQDSLLTSTNERIEMLESVIKTTIEALDALPPETLGFRWTDVLPRLVVALGEHNVK